MYVLPWIMLITAFLQPPNTTQKKLTITPAPESRPALRHHLLPAGRDRMPGNAALGYFRTFAARPATSSREESQQAEEKMQKWEEMPVAELPVDAIRTHLQNFGAMFKELDKAVVCERCDWEMNTRIKADGIGVILSEVQPAREVARYLSLRIRMELAANNYEAAAHSMRSGLQLSRDIGHGSSLIQLLVGQAIQMTILERADDWIARPGSPNLYWSLTSLPHPLIDPHPAFDAEMLFLDKMFPGIREFESGPLSVERANKLFEVFFISGQGITKSPDNPNPKLDEFLGKLGMNGYIALKYPDAKKELLARGRPAKLVDAYAPAQAVAINSFEKALELRDGQWKWIGQPYFQIAAAARVTEEKRKKLLQENNNDVIVNLMLLLLPAGEKMMQSAGRLDRRLALLRTIEAIRMYADSNQGVPPARLSDITAVPVPDDPMTGKPFVYSVNSQAITLTGATPVNEQPNLSNTIVYEITIKK